MRTLSVAAALLLCVWPVTAQVVATPGRSPSAVPQISIRNAGSTPAVAFAVAMNPLQNSGDVGQFIVFSDVIVDATDRLNANQERTIPVLLRTRPGIRLEEVFELPMTTAVIYADGTTAGDVVLLTRLMVRRCNRLLAVDTASDALTEASKHNIPRSALVAQFRSMAESLNHWYLPPEQQIGRDLYRSISEKLSDLPDPTPGAAFPPATFVAEQLKTLNQDRVTLLGSKPHLSTATFARAR